MTHRHRIAVAGLARESNSFAGGLGTVDDFRRLTWLEGEELYRVRGSNDGLAGALAVAERRNAEVVPLTHARSSSGPPVTAAAWAELRARVLDPIAAVADEVDGVHLRLHGAMTAENCDDVEGDLLQAVRAIIGPDKPISASLDLHAHGTRAMIEATPLIAGFLTYPHVDMAATGERAMNLLLDQLDGKINATAGFCKIPVMSASEIQNTTEGPVAEVHRMREALVASGELVDATILTTQPWLDVTELGWTVITITDDDQAAADRLAQQLGQELWDRRERLFVTKTPVAEALDHVRERAGRGGPVVVGDGADSPSAGSTGDSPEVLEAILAADLPGEAICSIVDHAAVQICVSAGIGAEVTVRVGGTLSPHFFSSTEVTGRVVTIADGSVSGAGRSLGCGIAVVLRIGSTSLVITEYPTSMVDDSLYRRVGLDVTTASVVQAKSAGQYRDGFAAVAAELIDLDLRGPAQHDLLSLPFTRALDPIWPRERDVSFPARS